MNIPFLFTASKPLVSTCGSISLLFQSPGVGMMMYSSVYKTLTTENS